MNDLIAAVVHDVKNQLAELSLRLEKRGDAQLEMMIVMGAARRLTEMLLVYRQDNDLLRVNSDSVNAADFLMILVADYKELFPSLVIETHAEKSPAFAFFDDALVRMALANALHNACRFARSRVDLAAYEKNKMLVLEISDDGPGYPDSLLANSGAEPSPVSGRGTGLGLYMARRIAELHSLENRHGYIELSNDGGAVFRILLP
jgi:signal transduction histidine kinase